MMRRIVVVLVLGLLVGGVAAEPEVETKVVEYRDGDTVLEGYLAWLPSARASRRIMPGVLIVHQWKGLGEFERKQAERLAKLGYVAFAVDIYGKGVRPANAQEASAQSSKYRGANYKLYRQRLKAGLAHLHTVGGVDTGRIAAIGYCFGGTGVLELARSGANIAGVVSFHGGLGTNVPEDAGNIRCKVLVCHGANDPLVPDEQLVGFMKEMRDAKVDWQLNAYGGAVHAFTDPAADQYNSPAVGYDASADRRSWQAMRAFFDECFAE